MYISDFHDFSRFSFVYFYSLAFFTFEIHKFTRRTRQTASRRLRMRFLWHHITTPKFLLSY